MSLARGTAQHTSQQSPKDLCREVWPKPFAKQSDGKQGSRGSEGLGQQSKVALKIFKGFKMLLQDRRHSKYSNTLRYILMGLYLFVLLFVYCEFEWGKRSS